MNTNIHTLTYMYVHMTHIYMKTFDFLISREMQIKMSLKFYISEVRMGVMKKTVSAGKNT